MLIKLQAVGFIIMCMKIIIETSFSGVFSDKITRCSQYGYPSYAYYLLSYKSLNSSSIQQHRQFNFTLICYNTISPPTYLNYTEKLCNIIEYNSIYKVSKLDKYRNIILIKKHAANNQNKKALEIYRTLVTKIVDSKNTLKQKNINFFN